MNRRNLLRNIGTAAIGIVAVAGTASASSPADLGIDRTIDVSSVEGDVTLDELLTDEDLERLSDDVDPATQGVTVDATTDEISLAACCVYCKGQEICAPGCACCRWEIC